MVFNFTSDSGRYNTLYKDFNLDNSRVLNHFV